MMKGSMLTALVLLVTVSKAPAADFLAAGFASPPLSARPHTWWHWMNGNVTKEGITADLEAMKQVGIGGAQMFTVDQGIPAGSAPYAGPKWRELTTFAVKEAARLGMELCIANCAGWSSSGGPWITPENAMQVIAWSEKKIQGPAHFSGPLPQAKAPAVDSEVPFYRDIAVYAYPTPAKGDVVNPRPGDFLARTGVVRGDGIQIDPTPLASGAAIRSDQILSLTDKLDKTGNLTWDVPEGNWTILRVGHVPTGVHNHPAPPEGDGLEVDKMSREALDTHWAALMSKVLSDAGPLAKTVLNNCLIDSYEVGSQNWTPRFREEFLKRRGYDPLPFLPIIAGRTIDTKDKSERFLFDVRRTIADLFADNYYGYMAELCHRSGIKFSAEPYGNGGFDNIQSGSKEDIPMAEFWLGGGAMETTKMVASVGHIYGRPIVGAESFTGDDVRGRWLEEPYMLKALGDLAFCNGINRYIFHRYAMQPWLNLNPGMTMGPWGTHLERTQTWWTEAATWLKYVARCQYLLQQGRFVADVCYYYGENAPLDLPYGGGLTPKLPPGYDYDGCDLNGLMLMSVKHGRLVLPSGMEYRLLVLPNTPYMSEKVARKIQSLVAAGATVYGPRPTQSPSLTNYPNCDSTVSAVADALWGSKDLSKVTDGPHSTGRVVWNVPIGDVLKGLHTGPDFDYSPRNFSTKLADIHRKIGATDVYFVSNQNNRSTSAKCSFRVTGRVPELWHPETGKVEEAPAYSESNGQTYVWLPFTSAESVFVVFRKPSTAGHLTDFALVPPDPSSDKQPKIQIESARYESADGRGADVTAKVRDMVADGQFEIPASNGLFGDPVVNVVKHLKIAYLLNGKPAVQTASENETVALLVAGAPKIEAQTFDVAKIGESSLELTPWKPDLFVGVIAGKGHQKGKRTLVSVKTSPLGINLSHNWHVTFPPKLGAPASASFPNLVSWTDRKEFGIKYFSGSAHYTKTFTAPASFVAKGRAIRLDLGHVKNFATVTVNGQRVAVLWKPPFALDVTKYVRPGANTLDVKVTNLWVNRLIGDEHFPADVQWQDGHLAKWPDWMVEGKPRPNTGRITFATWHFWSKDSPLLESGLIGPVVLQSAKRMVIRF